MKPIQRILVSVLVLILLLPLFGCGTTEQSTVPTISTGTGSPNLPDTEEAAIYTRLFDLNNTILLSLDMSDDQLQKMQNDYDHYTSFGSKSPIYRMADLHITITTPDGTQYSYTIEEVGVRMKGNTSRTDFYNSEEGIYNIIHLKLSFGETFDNKDYYGNDAKTWDEDARKERKNRTFATLEKLDLRWNRCDDSTYLKEYFAYQTYRQYGVLAPMTNLCSFQWAGNQMGVFTINEPIDKIFLEKNLPAAALGGDLYKVGWAGWENGSFTNTNSIGIEDEDAGAFYAYDLKTNKKTSTHKNLISLINEFNKGNMTKERFAQLVDVDNFLPFAAVSYLLGNPDDLRNNYNNFYLYFRADTGQAMIIPYDYDRCLGVTAHWNPTGNGVTSDNPFSDTMAATGEQQKNPLYLYSVVEGGFYLREFAHTLKTISTGAWFTYENFAALYAVAQYNYGQYTTPSKEFYNTQGLKLRFDLHRTSDFSSNDNISFREYLEAKLQTLEQYLAKIDQYDSNTPAVSPMWYIRADVTNWQNDDRYAMNTQEDTAVIVIKVSDSIRLKVYNDKTGAWYGAECVPEDCAVPFDTDSHTNIILQQGTYRIIFDFETETITLIKE